MTRLHGFNAYKATNFRVIAALLLLGALVAPITAAAQSSSTVRRIAFVNSGPAAPNAVNVAAFKAGLVDHGYIEGRNIIVDFRWGDQNAEQLPALVSELLAMKPDVIVSTGGPATVRAVKAATSTVPVVFITGDPVAEGIVTNLARPAGNLTGLAVLAQELDPKRLEMLLRIVPRAKRVAVIWNPTHPFAEAYFKDLEVAGKKLGLTLLAWKVRSREELEVAFPKIATAKTDALFILSDPMLGYERARIVTFAKASRLPAIYFWREFTQIGGLASYGTNLAEAYRRAASYVDNILKGARPGELAIEQPTKFELIINMKAAKELGIPISQSLLLATDEVIQ